MARQSSRNKSVPQKRKAEIYESDDDYLFTEVVDNVTRIDLPNNNASVEKSKEEEQDAAKNIAQVPKKSLPLIATMAIVDHPFWGVAVKEWA